MNGSVKERRETAWGTFTQSESLTAEYMIHLSKSLAGEVKNEGKRFNVIQKHRNPNKSWEESRAVNMYREKMAGSEPLRSRMTL